MAADEQPDPVSETTATSIPFTEAAKTSDQSKTAGAQSRIEKADAAGAGKADGTASSNVDKVKGSEPGNAGEPDSAERETAAGKVVRANPPTAGKVDEAGPGSATEASGSKLRTDGKPDGAGLGTATKASESKPSTDVTADEARPGTKSETDGRTDVVEPRATTKADETPPGPAGKAAGTEPETTGKADGSKPGTAIKAAGATADGPNATAAATEAKSGSEAGDQNKAAAGTAKAASKTGAETKPDGKTGDNTAQPADKSSKSHQKAATAVAAASPGRTTRVLRRANPVRVARSTARTTSAWAKRPSGRLILPALIAAVLLGAAGTAGAYLVPQALQSVPSPSVTPGFGVDASASAGSAPAGFSGPPGLPTASAPVVGGTLPGPQVPVGGARPADVLASWAQETGTRAGIPVVAVQAYGYAELVAGRTTPGCHLSWTTIAAIAKVESGHGSANGAVLNVDGSVAPPIRGLPLDGKGGRPEVRDHDQGALDGDTQYDRAVGPLQFFPETWTAISVGNGVDADNNGISDPNDIDDASLAAAKYLCQGGRDLAKPDAWWDAILSYNGVRPYAQKVFDAANEYGQRSRV